MKRAQLREILTDYFNLDELRTICFDLDIDIENLTGESKQAKAREIVGHCERNHLLADLVKMIHKFRPQLELPEKNLFQADIPDKPTEIVTVDSLIVEPAVARPVNLSFDVLTLDNSPSGWFNSMGFVSGVSPLYRAQVVAREDDLGSCVVFWRHQANEMEFGSLMQRCPAHHLAGKTIRLEAEIKTGNVEQWAGLWLRADGEIVPDLVFDNMSRRPIRGSTPWKYYSLEVPLPAETAWLNYGLVLSGSGTVWADNFKIKVWTSAQKWVDI